MFGNHLHRPGRVELGHHIKRPAVGQGGEKIAVIANAVADRRQAQNARMSADAQTAHGGNPSDAPLCCTLGDLHPLGQTRGAGGIENIGRIFRRWRNERRQCRTIPPAFGKILSTFNRAHRQQRRPFGQNSGHGLGQIRIGQNNGTGKGAVRDQLRHLRRRQARIDQGRHGAQAGQGQNDQTMFKKIRQHGGKPRARFDAPIRQPGGDDIDLPHHLGVCQPPVRAVIDNGKMIRRAFGGVPDQVIGRVHLRLPPPSYRSSYQPSQPRNTYPRPRPHFVPHWRDLAVP